MLVVGGCAQWRMLKDPDAAFEHKQYYWAAQGYLRKWKKADETERAYYASRLGQAYFYMADYTNAYQWLSKAYQLNPEAGADLLPMLVESAMGIEQYDSAQFYLNQYVNEPGYSPQVATRLQQGIQLARQDPVLGTIKRLSKPINTSASDCCPTLGPEGLYFTSQRKGTSGDRRSGWRGERFADIFVATFGAHGPSVRPLPEDTAGINSEYHEGTPWVVQQGDTTWLYFTRCAPYLDPEAPVVRCKIYRSFNIGDGWSTPERLVFIEESANEGHPS